MLLKFDLNYYRTCSPWVSKGTLAPFVVVVVIVIIVIVLILAVIVIIVVVLLLPFLFLFLLVPWLVLLDVRLLDVPQPERSVKALLRHSLDIRQHGCMVG
eukprot:GEZU01019386.1.p1 GENE.GEZU01019386.1~~GEZU01019386.1.p1  ORF type:complete len:100 (+),score=7.38 GEZU01019386.1:65-364(+)